MMEKSNPLNMAEIEALKEDFELLTFAYDFDLVYENQVPCAGIALIEGQIELIRDSRVEYVVNEGNLLGLSQLLEGLPVKFGCRVKAKSKIILLGKSDVLAFGQNTKSKLHSLVKATKTV
jgi:signal-transduction protein with cAMP-binding, CBS, and nucleotidyltransferase domain